MAYEPNHVASWLYKRLANDPVIRDSNIKGIYKNTGPDAGDLSSCRKSKGDLSGGDDGSGQLPFIIFNYTGGSDLNAAGGRAFVFALFQVKVICAGSPGEVSEVLDQIDNLLEGVQDLIAETATSPNMRLTARGESVISYQEVDYGVRYYHQGRSYRFIVSPEIEVGGYIGAGIGTGA